jgi:hypothetical protein
VGTNLPYPPFLYTTEIFTPNHTHSPHILGTCSSIIGFSKTSQMLDNRQIFKKTMKKGHILVTVKEYATGENTSPKFNSY